MVDWPAIEQRVDRVFERGQLAEPVVYIDGDGVEHSTYVEGGVTLPLRGVFAPVHQEVSLETAGVPILSVSPVLDLRRAALPEEPVRGRQVRLRATLYRIDHVERHGLDWLRLKLLRTPTSGV